MTDPAATSAVRRWHRLQVLLAEPVVGPMLRSRRLAGILALVGIAQLVLTAAQVEGLACPILAATGIPCPGCGLSRACVALLGLDLIGWPRLHVFAPVFVCAVLLLSVASILSDRRRLQLAGAVSRLEASTRVSGVLLSLIVVYWVVRLVWWHGDYGDLGSVRLP